MILNKGTHNCAQQRRAVSASHPLRWGDALNRGLHRLGHIRVPRTRVLQSVLKAEAHLGAQQQQQQQRHLAICFDLYHQIKIFLTRTKAEVRARLLQLLFFLIENFCLKNGILYYPHSPVSSLDFLLSPIQPSG